jgi:hypothetical protein
MPTLRIETIEYECAHCGYKWINRVNGKEGPVPKRCAKCKSPYWRGEDPMDPAESGLRTRLKNMKKLYHTIAITWGDSSLEDCWDFELIERFLDLNPRPTRTELRRVLGAPGVVLYLNSQNTRRQYIPDREKPGRIKWDDNERIELAKQDALKQQEAMRQIIDERSRLSSDDTNYQKRK